MSARLVLVVGVVFDLVMASIACTWVGVSRCQAGALHCFDGSVDFEVEDPVMKPDSLGFHFLFVSFRFALFLVIRFVSQVNAILVS